MCLEYCWIFCCRSRISYDLLTLLEKCRLLPWRTDATGVDAQKEQASSVTVNIKVILVLVFSLCRSPKRRRSRSRSGSRKRKHRKRSRSRSRDRKRKSSRSYSSERRAREREKERQKKGLPLIRSKALSGQWKTSMYPNMLIIVCCRCFSDE